MKEFRDRVLLPLAIPLVALAVIAFIVLNLSRVLLALEETSSPEVATVAAVVLASAVLFGCAYFAQAPGDRTTANMGALLMSGVVLIMGGLVGFAAVQEEEHAGEEGPALEPNVTVHAFDIGFTEKEVTAPPGDVVVEYINDGNTAHTFLFEGIAGPKLEVGSNGATDIGQWPGVAAGDYVYFCDIPGHRSAGMEGTLHVVEGAAPAGGEQTGGQEGTPEGGAEGGTAGETGGGEQSPAPEGGGQGGGQN